MQALEPDLPLYRVRTMEESLEDSAAQPRFNMLLLSLFAGAAVLLTAIGLYGVLAWTVNTDHTDLADLHGKKICVNP